uniref:Protein sleepless n=1 Tax=Anopheles atroparvus TaxID=41427 RepID=A0A182IYJ8_ANOAO
MAVTVNWLGLSVALMVLGATTVTTLRCYVCNSDDNMECLEPPKNFTEEEYRDNRTIPGRLLQACLPKDEQGREPQCRMQFLQVLGAGVPDYFRVWRECAYEPQPSRCYKFGNGGHKERVCRCFTDGCNSDPRPPPSLKDVLFSED